MTNDNSEPKANPGPSAAIQAVLGETASHPITPEVSERIPAAIAAESRARSSEEKSYVSALPRPGSFRRLLPLVASAAAIGMLGFLFWPLAGEDDTSATVAAGVGCTVSADAGADMSAVLHASGAAYTEESLAAQAESMAQQPAASCPQSEHDGPDSLSSGIDDTTPGSDSTDSAPSAEGDPESETTAERDSYQNPTEPESYLVAPIPAQGGGGQELAESLVPQELRVATLLSRCVVSLVAGRVVHAVDVASFVGEPAAVVVVDSPREVLVLNCGPAEPEVLVQQVLAR
jgi:hypothetical protein